MITLHGNDIHEIQISRKDGYLVNILDFTREDMPIEHIAHNLAHINRYGGAQPCPVSVGLHSIMVSYLVPEAKSYEALMHDATEALVGDMMHPIKRHCADFKAIEAVVYMNLVREYRLPRYHSWPVIREDQRARELECAYRRGYVTEMTVREKYVCDLFLGPNYTPENVVEMFLARYESAATISLQWH